MGSCFWADFVGCTETCETNAPMLNALTWSICGAFYCGANASNKPPKSLGINIVDPFDDYSEIVLAALTGARITTAGPAVTTVPIRAVIRADYVTDQPGHVAVGVSFSTDLSDPTELAYSVDYLDMNGSIVVGFNQNVSGPGANNTLVLQASFDAVNWDAVVAARVTILSNANNPMPEGTTATVTGVTLSTGWDSEC